MRPFDVMYDDDDPITEMDVVLFRLFQARCDLRRVTGQAEMKHERRAIRDEIEVLTNTIQDMLIQRSDHTGRL